MLLTEHDLVGNIVGLIQRLPHLTLAEKGRILGRIAFDRGVIDALAQRAGELDDELAQSVRRFSLECLVVDGDTRRPTREHRTRMVLIADLELPNEDFMYQFILAGALDRINLAVPDYSDEQSRRDLTAIASAMAYVEGEDIMMSGSVVDASLEAVTRAVGDYVSFRETWARKLQAALAASN